MGNLTFSQMPNFLPAVQLIGWCLWAGLVLLSVALLFLIRTRWGQSQPLRKCVFLSLWVHLLMAGFATTIQFIGASGTPANEPAMRILSVEGFSEDSANLSASAQADQPWERFDTSVSAAPDLAEPTQADSKALAESADRNLQEPEPLDGPLPVDAATPSEAEIPGPDQIPAEPTMRNRQQSEPAARIETREPEQQDPTSAGPPMPASPERKATASADSSDSDAYELDVPSSLLDQSVQLPRLSDVASVPLPADSLADSMDQTMRPSGRQTDARASDEAASGSDDASSKDVVDSAAEGEQRVNQGPGKNGESGSTGGAAPAARPAELGGLDPKVVDSLRLAPIKRKRNQGGETELPSIYRHRLAPDRLQIAEQHGGTRETEAAVEAALRWLAATQSPDGRWDARRFEAGRELLVAGRDRQGAGAGADTGVTGLTLLAFLGAGRSHLSGDDQQTVRAGLNYLLETQGPDGNLGGPAARFAFMYCHGMASFALSEAYAMTGDDRLEAPVRNAVRFSLSYQHPATGGWRYRRGELGDTSQLGWQLMALKSAELAGVPVPQSTRDGMIRFLKSVESGRFGGLASYRPGELATPAMTAEALVCRQFLGMTRTNPAGHEAAEFLIQQAPGHGRPNFYYWYYGTLGLFQQQGDYWSKWNELLQKELVETQRTTGALSGSWDPSTVWGGYGGRVYCTALAALCLEVYYRYLPLYAETARAE